MRINDDMKIGWVFVVLFILGMGLGALQGCYLPRRLAPSAEISCEWITPRLSRCTKVYCRDHMGKYAPCPEPVSPIKAGADIRSAKL